MNVETNSAGEAQAAAVLFEKERSEKPPTDIEVARRLLDREGACDPSFDKRQLFAGLKLIYHRSWPFQTCQTICCVGKGGANKSTTTIQLAVIAAKKGLSVLVLDCDRQRSVSTWSKVRGNDPSSIKVQECQYNGIEAACREGRKEGFNLILIDHPQQPGEAWPSLVRATDQFVLLARPTLFDLSTAQQWIRHLEAHQAPYFVVLSSAPARREMVDNPAVRDAREALMTRTDHLWQGQITARQPIVTATALGKGIIEVEPAGPASAEYIVLWHRVCALMKKRTS